MILLLDYQVHDCINVMILACTVTEKTVTETFVEQTEQWTDKGKIQAMSPILNRDKKYIVHMLTKFQDSSYKSA